MDKESLIHRPNHPTPSTSEGPSICVSPRRFALLLQLGLPHRSTVRSRLRPPLVDPAPTRPESFLHQLTHLITDQGMEVKTGCELETLLMNQQHIFVFFYTLPHLLICYLFVITGTITQGNSDSCTFTHCKHWTPPRACFQRLSLTSPITVHTLSTQSSTTLFLAKDFLSSHICNLTPLIQVNTDMQLLSTELCLLLFTTLPSQISSLSLIRVCLQIHFVACFHCKDFFRAFPVVKIKTKGWHIKSQLHNRQNAHTCPSETICVFV